MQHRSHSRSSASVDLVSSNNSLLYWLPTKWRVKFKLTILTHRSLLTSRPAYLVDLLQHHRPTKSTRLSCTQLLSVPRHSMAFGSPFTSLPRPYVQSVQNAAARLITGTKRCDHITPVLRQLHYLPVRQRVTFKLACLVCQSLSGNAPKYLADDIHLLSESNRRQLST